LFSAGRRRIPMAGIAAILLLAATAQARAALPPYWQRVHEIQAILDDGEVARKLGEAPVDRIEWTTEDHYRVQAGSCTLDIRIIGEARSDPGPRKFHLQLGDPDCK
jgi:hypothetical protein